MSEFFMKSNLKTTVAIVACAFCFTISAALQAQPDLKAAGKSQNPPNRDAAQRAAQKAAQKAAKEEKRGNGQKTFDKLAAREAERQEQRLERIPRYLTAYGITDEKVQQAILAHVKNTQNAHQNVSQAQLKVRHLLLVKSTLEPQIKQGIADLRKAQNDYEATFQKSLSDLNEKIAYNKNPRLEAALLSLGALEPKGISGVM